MVCTLTVLMNQARAVYADAARGTALERFLRHFRSDVAAELTSHVGERADAMIDNLEVLDVGELVLVRESIGAVWQRDHEHGRCTELVAINGEIDRFIAEAARRAPSSVPPELLSAISHDLRNPLGTIVLGATLLETKLSGDDRLLRSVEMIRRSAGKLEGLLDDVLDVAKLQSGSLELDRKLVSLRDVIDCAIDGNRAAAEEKRVSVSVAGVGGELVWCDRERLSGVIETLIENALRTSRQGDEITVRAASNGHVRLLIHPVRTVGRLDHFVVNGVIAAHGGELCFEDSTVTITLPVES